MQPRSSSNGYGRRKVERDNVVRSDNKFQTGKTNSSRTTFGTGKAGVPESPSHDRLIYFTTHLVGHRVEVQVADGSVFSGIFHAKSPEEFGIVLKMAHLIKDGSQGQKSISDFSSKPPATTLIIPPKDFVQVIAKGVPVTRDGQTNELQHDKQQELMTDSCISQSRHVEAGRELERWVPDENDPGCPEFENTFDAPRNRDWDQFKANATLFGVKSTFNEELYTTKLERGPQTIEREIIASRLAREIESEGTHDPHLAEDRGIQDTGGVEIDEETRFSSVYRGGNDSGYDDMDNVFSDSRNDETFGGVSSSVVGKPLTGVGSGKTNDGIPGPSRSSSVGEVQSSLTATGWDVYHLGSEDNRQQQLVEQLPKHPSAIDASRVHDNQCIRHAEISCPKADKEKQLELDQNRASKAEDSDILLRLKKESSDKFALSPNATTFDPSHAPSKNQENVSASNELSEGAIPPKTQGTSSLLARPSSSASSTSDRGGATSTSAGRGLSSSSSVGSLSSEKSMLNPHAKEFKLNPNAKSFVPSQTPLRPSSPVADSPFYYPANMASVTQIQGMPIGIGIGPSFAAQPPVMFNPQAAPVPQPYYHPNGPQYGQQMMIGQPRPVLYMPAYPTEMPYNGREF